MTVIISFLLAIAMGVESLVMFRNCADTYPVRLTHGMALSLINALFSTLMLFVGVRLCQISSSFTGTGGSNIGFLAMLVLVAVKIMLSNRKKNEPQAFDFRSWSVSFMLAVVLSVNTLFLGVGMGYLYSQQWAIVLAMVLMALMIFGFSYWGVMLGRKNIEMLQRRWRSMGVLLILASALLGLFVR